MVRLTGSRQLLLTFGTALLSTLDEAALVVTLRLAAARGREGRVVRRGTAARLTARENMAATV